MTCLDLGMSMPSVEFGNNAYVYKLWMDSRDEVVIQQGVPLSVLIGGQLDLLTSLGNALEVSWNLLGSVMISYLESLDTFIGNWKPDRVVFDDMMDGLFHLCMGYGNHPSKCA